MKLSSTLIFSLSCVLACNLASAANKVYKWKDDKGVVHFSEQPPLHTETEVIKQRSPENAPIDYGVGPTPTSAAPSSAKAIATKPAPTQAAPIAAETPSLKDKARCDAARKNQEILKTAARIKTQGENGDVRFLTQDEQQQKLKESELVIEQACE